MHILKKPSQSHKIRSMCISFPFINKIEQKSSKSFQQKIFLPLWQVKKKYNEIEDTLKAVEFLMFFNLATLQTWSSLSSRTIFLCEGRGSLGLAGCCFLSQDWVQAWLGNLSMDSPLELDIPLPCSLEAPLKRFPKSLNKRFGGVGLQKANS